MWNFLIGPPLSLLPERWRKKLPFAESVNWRVGAFVSGVFQVWTSICVLVIWYSYAVTHGTRDNVFLVLRGLHAHLDEPGRLGLIGFIFVALHPLTWVIGAWGVEGGIRALGAAITGEIVGTFPLWLIDWSYCAVRKWNRDRRRSLVPDEVTWAKDGDGQVLRIRSSRPKPNWQNHPTIRYREEFFQVIDAMHFAEADWYVYRLRRSQPGEIFRGLEDYDPQSTSPLGTHGGRHCSRAEKKS